MAGGAVNTSYDAGIMGVQDLQDTPFTAVSFTEKTIKNYSDPTQPLPSILVNDPSVRTTATTFYDDFSIRGRRLNGYQVLLNGVPNLFGQGSTPVNYVSRIDVTSGPAMAVNMATAYESAGGVVNMVSKKAEDKPVADVTLGFSGRGTYTQQIDVGQRFGKGNEWGIRVNALNTDGETSIPGEKKTQRNAFINVDHQDARSQTNVLFGYVDDTMEDSLRWFTFDNNLTYTPSAPDIHKNYGFKAMNWKADKWIATINHEQKISDNWSAFLNAGYGKYDIYHNINSYWRYTIHEDGSFDDYVTQNPLAYDERSFQIGVKGKVVKGDVTHNLVLAADRHWEKNYSSTYWPVDEKDQLTIGGNLSDGITTQPNVIPDYPYRKPYLKSKGVYTSWKLVDRMNIGKFDVLAGITKQQVVNRSIGSDSVKSHAVSPLYGLVYKPNDQLSFYASHSESFSSGSVISGPQYDNAGEILDPAKTKQDEVGVKMNNGRLMTGLALFKIRKANSYNKPTADPDIFHKTNDGEVEYKGLDWSFYGKLSDKWNLSGGLMYVDAKTKKSSGGTLDGIRKDGIPEWSGVLGLEYVPNDQWSFLARGVYSGSYTINDEKQTLPSYWMFDLGASYKTKLHNTPVTFSAMVYNLFDKAAWQPLAESDNIILSMPRTFMMSATFSL